MNCCFSVWTILFAGWGPPGSVWLPQLQWTPAGEFFCYCIEFHICVQFILFQTDFVSNLIINFCWNNIYRSIWWSIVFVFSPDISAGRRPVFQCRQSERSLHVFGGQQGPDAGKLPLNHVSILLTPVLCLMTHCPFLIPPESCLIPPSSCPLLLPRYSTSAPGWNQFCRLHIQPYSDAGEQNYVRHEGTTNLTFNNWNNQKQTNK